MLLLGIAKVKKKQLSVVVWSFCSVSLNSKAVKYSTTLHATYFLSVRSRKT